MWKTNYLPELEFSRTTSWSMVSILDSVHSFSFQFMKNDSTGLQIDCVVYKIGG